MPPRRKFLGGLLVGSLIGVDLIGRGAKAHRGHHGLSHLLIGKDGHLRLTHKFSAQDIEPELVTLSPDSQPSLDDLDSLKALITHLETGFLINNQALKLFDQELVDDRALFILEGRLKFGTNKLMIDMRFFPQSDHFQTLNMTIEKGGKKRGLRLVRDVRAGPIDLKRF